MTDWKKKDYAKYLSLTDYLKK